MRKKISTIVISSVIAAIGIAIVFFSQMVELSHSLNDLILSIGTALIIAMIYNIFIFEDS